MHEFIVAAFPDYDVVRAEGCGIVVYRLTNKTEPRHWVQMQITKQDDERGYIDTTLQDTFAAWATQALQPERTV